MPPKTAQESTDLMPETQDKSLMIAMESPTLDTAFTVLCAALLAHEALQENLPAYSHVEEILGWYANGNHGIAWQHAIQILEGVINTPLMTTAR